MYHSSGNYEAFARPKKPEGVEGRHAYLIGTGLAALSAACFLVRDAQMPGENVHLLEARDLAGGACDGWDYPGVGYTMRGGREMDNHFEVMWDLFRSVPSLEVEGASVLDEFYWLNKEDPNYSLCRATERQGKDADAVFFGLSDAAALQVSHLFLASDEELFNMRIDEVWDDEVLDSNFWMFWRTMFAFENWHSALEVKRYLQRYVHHIGGLPNFSALRFTRYNQYESMILPLLAYLEDHGVSVEYGVHVDDVVFDVVPASSDLPARKVAQRILLTRDGRRDEIALSDRDLLFITNGSCVENATFGSQNTAAAWDPEIRPGGSWDLWRRMAAQVGDGSFGRPETFCSTPELTNWMSATVETLDDEIVSHIRRVCHRDPFTGRVVTGGIVTARDSSWLLSWTVNRQPQFHDQPEGHALVWVYALFSDIPGDYVKKPMRDCTGAEICEEWLYHLGVPEARIAELAHEHANTVPCMMPYITAFFMPRDDYDRPQVVPEGAVNFAFIGQFAEVERDTIFTTEYSMRTGMEAVYELLDVDRAVPEVWGSVYDVRCLVDAMVKLRDGRKLTDMQLPPVESLALRSALRKVRGTDIEQLLVEHGAI